MNGGSVMTGYARLAVAFATVVVFSTATPRILADANYVSIDGPNNKFAADCGYKIETSTVNGRVVIVITLSPKAAKSFEYGELTLKKDNKLVVETICGLVRVPREKSGILKMTIDPMLFDGGDLTISSREIEGQVPPRNFAGFRRSLDKILAEMKAMENK